MAEQDLPTILGDFILETNMELAAHTEVYHKQDLAEIRKIAIQYYGSESDQNILFAKDFLDQGLC